MKMIQQIYRDKIEADKVDDEANNARQVPLTSTLIDLFQRLSSLQDGHSC